MRDRETVFVSVTFRGLTGVRAKDDRLRGGPDPGNACAVLKPGHPGDVNALAVLGAGRMLDQQAMGQAGDLPEQAKNRDKTRQISGSPVSHAILPRC